MLRVKELKEVQTRVDSMKNELETQQKLILKLQKQQDEILRLIRADQQMYFEEMGKRIGSLEGSLSENQHKLSLIDQSTQTLQKHLEEKARQDSLTVASKDAEVEKLFQIAYGDFTAGRFDVALNGLTDLLNKYPDSEQARDAAYWQAECYYAKKELEKAEDGYKGYIKKYPDGKKMCVSLYKLGLIYEKQGKGKSKQMVWNKMIESCPNAEETQMVKAKMGN
jgi:TolA-binding protein